MAAILVFAPDIAHCLLTSLLPLSIDPAVPREGPTQILRGLRNRVKKSHSFGNYICDIN
jgi:hypothetical protein